MSTDDQPYLSETLFERLSTSDFDNTPRKFMCHDGLEELITRASVLDAMQMIENPSEPLDEDDKRLVDFILHKATKVFAISVSVDLDQVDGLLKKAMQRFQRHAIDDRSLPFKDTPHSVLQTLEPGIGHRAKIWRDHRIHDFFNHQWRFLVPVFLTHPEINMSNYNLPASTIFPVVGKKEVAERGSFGKVFKAELHPKHIRYSLNPDVPFPNIVAIKAISPGEQENSKDVNTHWEREIKALERMNTRSQDHIVRFLTAFSRRRQDSKDYYLMFEWADGGSLRTLWETVETPKLCASLIKAAIRQIHGLAKAMAAAHDLDMNGASYRHGDLKPANILRFKGESVIGKLKIGDWGEAKEHNNSTEFRFSQTTARFATWRYAAPEVTIGVTPRWKDQSKFRRSRLYDIWAMGCIVLEFLIWMLYGSKGLNKFNAEFPDQSPFYQLKDVNGERIAYVHEVVTRWMDHMAKEPICQPHTALGRLLGLVRIRLLAVKLPRKTGTNLRVTPRSSSLPNTSISSSSEEGLTLGHSVQFTLGSEVDSLTNSPEQSFLKPTVSLTEIPSLVITPAERTAPSASETTVSKPDAIVTEGPTTESPSTEPLVTESLVTHPLVPVEAKPELPGVARILAAEFENQMKDILTGDEEGGDDYWFTDVPPSMPADDHNKPAHGNSGEDPSLYMSGPESNSPALPKDISLGAPPGPERIDYAHPKLDDEWEIFVDNPFATSVFSTPGVSDTLPAPEPHATQRLCEVCRVVRNDIFRPGFRITYATATLKERAMTRTCELCRLLWKACERYGGAVYRTTQFDRVGSVFKMNGGSLPVLSILRSVELHDQAAENIQIGFPSLPEAAGLTHIEVIRQCLQTCDAMHKEFACHLSKQDSKTESESERKKRLPTRLIDVGATGDDNVRLFQTADSDSGKWAALSHQWGPKPHFSTTRSNLQAHLSGIRLSALPATFRDAVIVTRALGLQYLWIDSICIIQGKDGDFNQEAKRMEEVYSGAYVVVAATCAVNHYSGFLSPRKARTFVTVHQNENTAPFYICEMIDDFKTHVLDSALSSRGWVMQEHALARRTIFFTEHQTYWECGEGVRCETMTKMKNNVAAFLGDPNFPQILINAPQGERILRYQQLYQTYSRLGLTNPYDRPVAIDGLQRRLLRTMNCKGGLGVIDEGEPKGLLRRSLLWRRGTDMGSKSLTRIKFPTDRAMLAVPSWSWMAYTGSIDYIDLKFGRIDWEDIGSPWSRSAEIISYTDDRGPSMALTADAWSYTYDPTKFNPHAEIQVEGQLFFDNPSGSDQPELMSVVLGIEKGEKAMQDKLHYVLVVKVTRNFGRNGKRICERVGAGYLPGKRVKRRGFGIIIH